MQKQDLGISTSLVPLIKGISTMSSGLGTLGLKQESDGIFAMAAGICLFNTPGFIQMLTTQKQRNTILFQE